MEGLGKGFWLKLIGGVLALGVALFIVFALLEKLVWAFGFLGGLLVAAGILLVIAWLYDKRQQTSHRNE